MVNNIQLILSFLNKWFITVSISRNYDKNVFLDVDGTEVQHVGIHLNHYYYKPLLFQNESSKE